MIRRCFLLIGAVALWTVGVTSAAETDRYREGVEYRVLETKLPRITAETDKVEVLEFFWYGCPHCFDLEPKLERWRVEGKADNAIFVRVPAALNPNWSIGAVAYYTAEQLGVLDQVHQPLFDAMHLKGRRLDTEAALAEFFAEQGVPKEDFEKAFNSFAVNTKLNRARYLGERSGIRGVPAIIVGGEYETSVSMAGSEENMLNVIDFLVKKGSEPST